MKPPKAATSLLLLMLAVAALLSGMAALPAPERVMAAYATSLGGRSRGQRHNARLAAQALDGRVVAPGATFSFNRTVDSWSIDSGYVKAPVSYDGELVRAFGGGVCQTSTTLYNAVLLAGLPIVERHPHVFRPHYIAPGRDAAVAFPGVDLRFRNPHRFPLTIHASADRDRLEVQVAGAGAVDDSIRVTTEVIDAEQPSRLTHISRQRHGEAAPAYLRSPGAAGYRVITYRSFTHNGRVVRRERLSDDSYPAMDRIVSLTEE